MRRSLAEARPDLIELYSEKNEVSPHDIGEGSHALVWWRCPKTQYEWKGEVRGRVRAHEKCVCCGKRALKSLRDFRPDLLPYYSDKNEKKPHEVHIGSHELVWWVCPNTKHEWKNEVRLRIKAKVRCVCCNKCPKPTISNNLNILFPQIAKDWDHSKNSSKPHEFLPTSKKRVFWKCKLGHETRDEVKRRVEKGCIYCFGNPSEKNNLLQIYPETRMWDSEKNPPSIHPSNILFTELFTQNRGDVSHDQKIRTSRKPWWKCEVCSHSWRVSINNFISKGCPKCKKPIEQVEVKYENSSYFSDQKYQVTQQIIKIIKGEFQGKKIRLMSMPHLGHELHLFTKFVQLDFQNSLAVEKNHAHAKVLKSILEKNFEAMPLVVADVDEYIRKQEVLPYDVVHLDYNGGLLNSHIEAARKLLSQKHKVIVFMTINNTRRNNAIFVEGDFPVLPLLFKELLKISYETNRIRCAREFIVVAYTNASGDISKI